ncbi:phosphodiester glycosidase family protein [Desertivirga xinjiangensis]|uniref:phosphodiester glycosidase family protein n=1 Tax=Desertivirga xinjiangensis TaxID=539206 RepID=UPI00210DA6CF|nr:phosphodiester glycosidase family protein [Pedobacter xinjiangensis]
MYRSQKKQFSLIASLLFMVSTLSFKTFAQTDSLKVVKAKWGVKKIAPKIHLKQFGFTDSSLFNSNQYISILEIRRGRRYEIDLVFEKKLLKRTSEFGKENRAIAAINAGFFNMKKGGSVDYIRSNGQLIDSNVLGKSGQRAPHQQAAILIKQGVVDIEKWDGTNDWEKHLDGEDVLESGPALLIDDQVQRLDSVSHNSSRHPRSALALKNRNKILFVVVDGRDANAAGMSLFELSKVLKWLGSREAISMDGGGSSALWIDGQPENGVVSYPSDNKIWDHVGERKVANALVVRRRK